MHTWLFGWRFVFVDLSLNQFIEALVQAASELCKGFKSRHALMLTQLFVTTSHECHAVIVTLYRLLLDWMNS